MAGWEPLFELIQLEIQQRGEEGCDTAGFRDELESSDKSESSLMALYERLTTLSPRPDFPFHEPSDLAGIRAARPDGPRQLMSGADPHTSTSWADRFAGAWLGRCAGCALGKPVESWPFMAGTPEAPGWRNIQRWYEGADSWPIDGYVPAKSRAADEGLHLAEWCLPSTREHIAFMQSDDDLRYTVVGLVMLEEQGADFDTWAMGKLWHRLLPYQQMCTAETQAYLNFAQVTSHLQGHKPDDWPERIAWTRTHLNPYREWIGAQIRADGLAYGSAGNPERAAEWAWRDASLSHVKNGIYGEMFVAAMIAAAFVETDNRRIVEIGLSEIPANSRLGSDVRQAINIADSATDQIDLVSRIWDAFKGYHPVHTNNNAALVAACLLFAGDDFEKAITTAVLGGWDTDCNGATVGSIMGAKLGQAALPEKWITPLNDTLYGEVIGFHPIAISSCARRSHAIFEGLL